jgi:uncharacterized protein (TIGR02996 family)
MSDGEALLRGILECPEDDTARLVYADWLDEQGERERAEFVRVQIELAKTWACSPSSSRYCPCSHCVLRRRERELWNGTGRQRIWGHYTVPGLNAHLAIDTPPSGFVPPLVAIARGFVESLTCTATDFLAHAAAVFAAHPVTAVRLSDREPLRFERPGDGEHFFWYDDRRHGGYTHGPAYLPAAIYDRIDWTFDLWPDPRPNTEPWSSHRSREAALDALSEACVAYGRERARAELGAALGVTATQADLK